MPTQGRVRLHFDLDATATLLYIGLVVFGLMNIFAAGYDPTLNRSWLDFSLSSTKQIIFIITAAVLIVVIMLINYSLFDTFAIIFYVATLLLLVLVLFIGKEVKGDRAWIAIGSFTLQPSEFAKFTTALALAKYLTLPANTRPNPIIRYATGLIGIPTFIWSWLTPRLAQACLIIALPTFIILLQGDTGSAMVFSAFIFVLYREGLIPNWVMAALGLVIGLFVVSLFVREEDLLLWVIIPILTVALSVILLSRKRTYRAAIWTMVAAGLLIMYVISVEYIFNNFLEPHQKNRILVLIDPEVDAEGRNERYNLKHSLVAIGSGGLWGKGFLQGTQTKLDYVPEQTTDFIFCTIGEEYGWLGSIVLIMMYLALFSRLITLAERQRDKFARIYGYGVASILFFHFTINLAMTIGMFPVVGIPLPFISAGGSSLWAFSILLFIFLRLDAHRESQMERK